MLSCQVRKERQPRSRNGQPAQSTIGVASVACTHCDHVTFMRCGSPEAVAKRSTHAVTSTPGNASPMARRRSGTVRTSATQNRRNMSTSSGFGPSPADGANGSSAMPQIGQLPGPTLPNLRVHWAGVDDPARWSRGCRRWRLGLHCITGRVTAKRVGALPAAELIRSS